MTAGTGLHLHFKTSDLYNESRNLCWGEIFDLTFGEVKEKSSTKNGPSIQKKKKCLPSVFVLHSII